MKLRSAAGFVLATSVALAGYGSVSGSTVPPGSGAADTMAAGDTGSESAVDSAAPAGTAGASDTAPQERAAVCDAQIRIAAVPINDSAPVYWSEEDGIFDEHGLDVEFVQLASGQTSVQAIIAGDIDLAVTSTVPFLTAVDQDLPLQIVSGLSNNVPEGERDSGGAIMVLEDSGIDDLTDLEGMRAAAGGPGGIGFVYFQAAVEQAGVDPASIEMLPISNADALTALSAGEVDAVLVGEPFVSRGLSEGAKVISWTFREVNGPENMIAFLVARSDFVEENADILDCVNQSVQEAISRFQDPARRDEYLGILGEFTGLTAEQISTIQLANLTHIADPDLLAKTAQMLVDLEVTEELVDVEGLITESAQS